MPRIALKVVIVVIGWWPSYPSTLHLIFVSKFNIRNLSLLLHSDPEQRIGSFECHRGSEDILVILECVPNLRKRIWNVSNSTFLEIHKNIFEKNLYRDSQNTKLPQLYCSSWHQLFIKLYWLQALYKAGTYLKLIKDQFSHTGCPKNQNGLILMQKLRYKYIIKISGPLKSF